MLGVINGEYCTFYCDGDIDSRTVHVPFGISDHWVIAVVSSDADFLLWIYRHHPCGGISR